MKKKRVIIVIFILFILLQVYTFMQGENKSQAPSSAENHGTGQNRTQVQTEDAEPSDAGSAAANSAYQPSRLLQMYDGAKGMFRQQLANGKHIYTSVPDRMITNGGVRYEAAEGIACEMYRNDIFLSAEAIGTETEEGIYRLVIKSRPDVLSDGDQQSYEAVFNFRIMKGPVADLRTIDAPDGYLISAIYISGNLMAPGSRNAYHLPQDGDYRFILSGIASGLPRYDVSVALDTTPPVISLTGVNNSNEADRTVTFRVAEEGSAVTLYKNDMEQYPGKSSISEPGKYVLVATDPSGNQSSVSFTIRFSTRKGLLIAAGALCALLFSAMLYIFYLKKTFRVR